MMGFIGNAVIKATQITITMSLHLNKKVPEIPTDGLIEKRDVEYCNRGGGKLLMDIFRPADPPADAGFPVIINVHGGGLVMGSKNYSVGFCRSLAKRGYLVFSLEYRLIPDVTVYEQIADVCAGMDCAAAMLAEYNGDPQRVYIAAESAGAYLAVFTTAMQQSKPLRDAIGSEPGRLAIRAAALISGMFYTRRVDKLGLVLSPFIYGGDQRSRALAKLSDPESAEISGHLPPCYLVTSKADMLERYTLDFAGALENRGIEHLLRHMGSGSRLIHAFPVLRPDYPESQRVIDEIICWFDQHSPAGKT